MKLDDVRAQLVEQCEKIQAYETEVVSHSFPDDHLGGLSLEHHVGALEKESTERSS